MILRFGLNSPAIATIKEWLNFLGFPYIKPDGKIEFLKINNKFDLKMESAVIDFQESEGILTDGIIGPITMRHLEEEYSRKHIEINSPGIDFTADGTLALEKLYADAYKGGYSKLWLRSDAAYYYEKVREEVISRGGILTSSGGMRRLDASVTSNRSATSFHYVGLALDLYIYSAMIDPKKDPYVACFDGNRSFTVYARCSDKWDFNQKDAPKKIDLPEITELTNVVTYKERDHTKNPTVRGRFINLTEIFKENGFERIRGRRTFFNGGKREGAEWWHFQFEKGLIPEMSTFGSQLLKIYSKETLEGTNPWRHRGRVFQKNWF